MRPMILFNQVNKWYGEYQALTDVSAEIKSGEVVVVCGPSGSGKSTLIRTVNRLEPIEKGQILFDGVDIHGSAEPTAYENRLCLPEFQSVSARFGAGKYHDVASESSRREAFGSPTSCRGTAGKGGTIAQGRRLSGTAFRRPAAAGGYRPGAGDEAACHAV